MVNHHLLIALYKDAIALFCAASISVSSPADTQKYPFHHYEITSHNKTELWHYLRKGINYLEASGKDVPLDKVHPGGKAYGPLALTPIAVRDVQMHYPRLARHSFKDVISKRSLYEKFAFIYADLLLRHYIRMDYFNMPRTEVFEVLQRAWFLGPTLYEKGHPVIASRELQALQYISKTS